MARPLSEWFREPQLGVFIHWGLYSVPAFAPPGIALPDVIRDHFRNFCTMAPYVEWYRNAMEIPESPTARFHAAHYGRRRYESFREEFERGLAAWDPEGWADEIGRSGARYVVFVTKHHDGFSLWPTAARHPRQSGWHTKRDCVSELSRAVRSRGMRFGVYYSGGVDWSVHFEPGRSLGDFLAFTPTGAAYARYAEEQVRELIDLVSPDVIWNDIAWPTSQDRVDRLFDDYYRKVPEGVVNDRWGTPSALSRALRVRPLRRIFDVAGEQWVRRRGVNLVYPVPPRCDFRTPEYAELGPGERMKWEATRGMGHSFGYNREETLLSIDELRAERDRILGKGGNLLLNIGPRGEDAAIPPEQIERLRALGSVPFARAAR